MRSFPATRRTGGRPTGIGEAGRADDVQAEAARARPFEARLVSVARALAAAHGPVSGEALARAGGVSRAAVRKYVGRLVEAGAEIEALPGVGYKMTRLPDRPDAAGIAAWRAARAGLFPPAGAGRVHTPPVDREAGEEESPAVIWMPEVTSTNDVAVQAARRGAAEGTIVTADVQTAGRGRRGRTWRSPRGGLYLSVVLRPPLAPAALTSLGLVVALAVAGALDELGVEGSTLKWPNDVLLEGRKVAGVLVEASVDAERVAWAAAGVGVDIGGGAGVHVGSRAAMAAALLDALEPLLADLYRGRGGEVVVQAAARCETVGARVRVTGADGAVVEGIATGLADDGALMLSTASGETRLASGDVERVRQG
jgi:BirA family transcriptional regulator, biotin operon repressor / biotin---[acetyl-CoA-carboxylase] ligase